MRRIILIALAAAALFTVVLGSLFVYALFTGQATLTNIASEANIDEVTDAWWAEDRLEPVQPVVPTPRRIDRHGPGRDGAGLHDDYIILYLNVANPRHARALQNLLAFIQTTRAVRVVLKHLPQDGMSTALARCYEELRAWEPADPQIVRDVLATMDPAIGEQIGPALDTGRLFDAMVAGIEYHMASGVGATGNYPCTTEVMQPVVDADVAEAARLGVDAADGPVYVINGMRVHGTQDAEQLAALVEYTVVVTRGQTTERAPTDPHGLY